MTALLAIFAFVFLVTEVFYPISVLPFATTAAAVVLILAGETTVRHLPAGRRRALIAMFVLLILSLRYLDAFETKPFARDMFRVHRGMTGAQVEAIMRRHLKYQNQAESEWYLHLQPHFTGEAWYQVNRRDIDYGKVAFKDGRAVDAETCFCD